MDKPKVGEFIIHHRLGVCEVVADYSAGKIDVETESGKWYRIPGLAFI